MAERAAHVIDHVLPDVPVRQWVLSLPYRLRYQLAWDHELCRAVVAVFIRTVLGALRARARRDGVADGRSGAVAVIQRFGGALSTDRARWQSAAELPAHAGIAPVTVRSGKSVWVHHRLACPKFVKQTFHEFADQSIRFSRWARAYYDQQRARGSDHHAALRALAIQMDADSVSLLAGTTPAPRGRLHRRLAAARLAAGRETYVTAQLRCPCRLRRWVP